MAKFISLLSGALLVVQVCYSQQLRDVSAEFGGKAWSAAVDTTGFASYDSMSYEAKYANLYSKVGYSVTFDGGG